MRVLSMRAEDTMPYAVGGRLVKRQKDELFWRGSILEAF
jgi:hypothetical protein